LAVGRVELPPLREREGDVRFLARVFCERLGGNPSLLTEEVLARFDDYAWPGNVRELRNGVARVLVLGEFAPDAEDFASSPGDGSEPAHGDRERLQALAPRGDSIARVLARNLSLQDARQALIDEFEQRYVEYMLAEHDGNVTRAAAAAGVARRHAQRVKAKFERKG
jgi:DNA-binding NtrC family response regulator